MKQLQKSTLTVVIAGALASVAMLSSAKAWGPPRVGVPAAEADENATVPAGDDNVTPSDNNSSDGVAPSEAPVPTEDENATIETVTPDPIDQTAAPAAPECTTPATCEDACRSRYASWAYCCVDHPEIGIWGTYKHGKRKGQDIKCRAPKKAKPSPPAPKDGVDGKDGRGIVSVVVNDEGSVIVTFDDGTTHNAGRLPVGHDGRGITSSVIDGGHLIIFFTDGTSQDMGRIVGRDGKDGTETRLVPFVGLRTGWDGKALGIGGNFGVEFRFEDLVFEAEVAGLNASKGSLDRRWSGLVEFRVGLALLDGKLDAMVVGNYGQSSFDPLGGWMRRRWTAGAAVDFRPLSFISSEKYEWWKEVLEVHLQVSGGQQWTSGQTWSEADPAIGVEFGLGLRLPINL